MSYECLQASLARPAGRLVEFRGVLELEDQILFFASALLVVLSGIFAVRSAWPPLAAH